MKTSIVKKERRIKGAYIVYEGIRRAFLFGLNIRPILEALDAKPGDRILDAGCGYGFFSKYLGHCDYVGIDNDPERIGRAIKNFGEAPRRKFIVGDVCNTNFLKDSFNKALCYGLLHHLSDADAQLCLAETSRIVTGNVVFSDPVHSEYHFINNLLCRLDEGKFVRDPEAYMEICRKQFIINSVRCFHSNNYLAQYFLMVASKKVNPVTGNAING
jgi:SAM-dependent methyltransferase